MYECSVRCHHTDSKLCYDGYNPENHEGSKVGWVVLLKSPKPKKPKSHLSNPGAMFALRRGLRRFSTEAPRKEYPKSFISHLRTQKLNVFNIGIAFLTLSLSSQLVTYKQRCEKAQEGQKQLEEKVEVLEKLVLELGGTLPDEEALAAAKEAAKQQEEQAKRQREEEAKALTKEGDKKGKKSLLI